MKLRYLIPLLLCVPMLAQSWSGQSTSDARIVPPYRFCLGSDNGQDFCLKQTGVNAATATGSLNITGGLTFSGFLTVGGIIIGTNPITGTSVPLDASQYTVGSVYANATNMCQKIANAVAFAQSTGAYSAISEDAFNGNQYCDAVSAPTFLYGSAAPYTAVSIQHYWGNVNIFIDGPSNGLYWTDGVSSTYGTPGIMVPSYTRFIGPSSLGSTLTVCTGAGTPIAQCTHAAPQRNLGTVSSTVVVGTVMTVNVTGVTLTASTNIWVGEHVQIVGAGTASNNVNRTVQSVPSSSSFTVNVPSGTSSCSATCGGTVYGFTPIIAPAPGVGGGPYIPVQSVSGTQGFGQYIGHWAINEQGNQADSSHFTGYGITGYQNVNGGDQDVLEDIEAHYVTGQGFEIGPGSTDSAYRQLRVQNFSDTHEVPSSLPLYIAGPRTQVDGFGIIGSGSSSPKINTCIQMDGTAGFIATVNLLNGHSEDCVDEIQTNANNAARGLKVDSYLGSPNGSHSSTNIIHMLNDGGICEGCVFTSIERQSSGSTNTILDDNNGNTIVDLALSSYQTDVAGNVAFTTAKTSGNTLAGNFCQLNSGILNCSGGIQVGGNPVSPEVFTTLQSALAANYNAGSAKTIFTPTANTVLRVCVTEVSANVPTGATLPSLTLGWTDPTGTSKTQALLSSTGSVNAAGVYATNGINASSAAAAGVCADPIVTNTSTVVTVTSASYAAGSGTALTYDLVIEAQRY